MEEDPRSSPRIPRGEEMLSQDMNMVHFNNPSNFAKDLMPRLSLILTEAIKEAR